MFGDGIFEGIRAYHGKLFLVKEHIDRLYDSAKGLQLNIPVTKGELSSIIEKTVEINKLKDAHISSDRYWKGG